VRDRIDEQLEFALPDNAAREQLLSLYFARYVDGAPAAVAEGGGGWFRMLRGSKATADSITLAGIDKARGWDKDAECRRKRVLSSLADPSTSVPQAALIRRAAQQTEGFSGRELAKLMAAVQAAAYATRDATLTPDIFSRVVSSKVRQHAAKVALDAPR